MAITKRIVNPSKKIKDYRYSGGNYYEAFCEQCGRKFYPNRSTAKFCSKFCGNESSKGNINADKEQNLIEAGYYDLSINKDLKEKVKPETVVKIDKVKTFIGSLTVYNYISKYYDTNRKKGAILRELKDLNIGDKYIYDTDSDNCVTVRKKGPLTYVIL